jgi:hypothetical protein
MKRTTRNRKQNQSKSHSPTPHAQPTTNKERQPPQRPTTTKALYRVPRWVAHVWQISSDDDLIWEHKSIVG